MFDRLVEALGLSSGKLEEGEKSLEVKTLLREYSDVFALDKSELRCTNIIRHSIDTGDHCPVKQPLYRTTDCA